MLKPDITCPKRDSFFAGLIFVVIFASLLFTRGFAYAPGILGLVGVALYWQDIKPAFKSILPALVIGGYFLLLGTASALWSDSPDDVYARVSRLALVFFPALLLLLVVKAKQNKFAPMPFLYGLAAIWIVSAAITCIEQVCDYPFYKWVRDLPADTVVHGHVTNWNIIALCAVGWSIVYGLLKARSAAPKLHYGLSVVIIGLLIFSLIYTWSQSAQLGFVMAVGAMVLPFYRHQATWWVLGGLIALGILFSPWVATYLYSFVEPGNRENFNWFLSQGAAGPRLEIWDVISQYIFEKPILGYGLEMTRHTTFKTPLVFMKIDNILHPHNVALQLWVEFGIIGAISGSLAFIYMLQVIGKTVKSRLDLMLLGAFLILFCAILTGYGVWQSWFIGLSMVVVAMWVMLVHMAENFPQGSGVMIAGQNSEGNPTMNSLGNARTALHAIQEKYEDVMKDRRILGKDMRNLETALDADIATSADLERVETLLDTLIEEVQESYTDRSRLEDEAPVPVSEKTPFKSNMHRLHKLRVELGKFREAYFCSSEN